MIHQRRIRQSLPLGILLVLGLLIGGCSLFRANQAPVAVIDVTIVEGYAPLETTLDGGRATDPDGDALSYAWDFGDGTQASGSTATHTYAQPGSYEVTLRVVDRKGAFDETALAVEVREIPEGFVALRMAWQWEGEAQRLDALVPWNLYQMYRGQLRVPLVDNYEYGAFVEDPQDDPTLGDLADALWGRAGGTTTAYVRYVLGFVQDAIAYRADPPTVEWPLYPLETLVDRAGDCEDTSILYVSLLRARGIPCKLAFVDTDGDRMPDHVLALVPASIAVETACEGGPTVFDFDGSLYAVAETTGSLGLLDVGCDPWGLSVDDVAEIWSF